MKKIAIITITDNNNFGNRLQNYALEQYLIKRGIKVQTLWPKGLIKYKIKKFIKVILSFISVKYKRICNFMKFTEKYTHMCCSGYTERLKNHFDYFIIGSDQIWNFNGHLNKNKFLIDIDKNKLIAFAPSFGVSDVQVEYRKWYRNIINNVKFLSVREDAGKKLIKEYTGRTDVEVLIDPTMLLTADEWSRIMKKPKQLKHNKFILNYFLGELSNTRKNEINRIAKENNCEIINILDKNSKFYKSGPKEFLYLEKNAFLICTDSFHSCVFAILFDKPFLVFDRVDKRLDNMNSRIETLIKKFNISNRKFEGKITEKNLKHDYTKAYEILEKERAKSKEFLENIIK